MLQDQKQYYAFISYKREDKRDAKRLQHQLEYYRLPNQLRKDNPDLPEYVRPVFRDMTDLEVGELSTLIHEALEQSHYLIVVCSPRAAKSKWVNDEVEYFISLGKQDKIIPYIIEGVPHADDPSEECYPPALLQLSKEKELLGANINEVGKEAAGIRVIAKMFGIRYDTLYQRYQRDLKQRQRLLWSLIFVFTLISLSIIYIIWSQNVNIRKTQLHLQRNLALAVAAKAEGCLANNDAFLATCLALQVLPKEKSSIWTLDADELLRKSLLQKDFILYGPHDEGSFYKIYFTEDDNYLIADYRSYVDNVSGRANTSFCIYDMHTGAFIDQIPYAVGERHSDIISLNECYEPVSVTIKDSIYTLHSPSIRTYITKIVDNKVEVYNTFNKLIRIIEHANTVNIVLESTDNRYIVSSSNDNTIRICSMEDASPGYNLIYDLGQEALGVKCNSNGEYICVLTYANIMVFSTYTQDIVLSTQTFSGNLAFNPCKNDECVYYDDYGHVIICNLIDLSADTLICDSTIMKNTNICYSPNGERILYLSESLDNQLKSIDVKSKISSIVDSSLKGKAQSGDINGICYSPHSTHLITYHKDFMNEVLWDEYKKCTIFETSWDMAYGADEFINETYGTSFDWTNNYDICEVNENIFSVCEENMLLEDRKHKGDIIIYDIKKQRPIDTLSCNAKNHVLQMQYNKTGTRVLALYADGVVAVWDLVSNTYNTSFNLLPNLHACSATFSADGNSVIVCLTDGQIILWDMPPYISVIEQATKRIGNRELTPKERRKYYLE